MAARTNGAGDTYTTGDVSRMLGIAPRTVALLVDQGRLRGHAIPQRPGCQAPTRRIHRAALVEFCRENGIPLPDGVSDAPWRVLCFGCPEGWLEALASAWTLQGPPQWLLAFDLATLGWHCRDLPHVGIVHGAGGKMDASAALAFLAARSIPAVAVHPEDGGLVAPIALACGSSPSDVVAALAALVAPAPGKKAHSNGRHP